MLDTKGMRFPIDVILVCVRWYVAYPLSYRHLEEMMEKRSVFVDHSSINRWAIRFLPLLEKVFRKHKHPVGGSWRMDETYIKKTRHQTDAELQVVSSRRMCSRWHRVDAYDSQRPVHAGGL